MSKDSLEILRSSNDNQNTPNSSIQKVTDIVEKPLLNKLSEKLFKWEAQFLGISPKVIPVITYEYVFEHFRKIHLRDSMVKRAAVIRQPYSQNERLTHLILMCLDEKNEPVKTPEGKSYTVEYLVDSLDNELANALHESNNVLRFLFK